MTEYLRPFIIGICGGSGTGKTRLASRLQTRFGADRVCLLHLDDYYRPAEQQARDEAGELNFDHPAGIDAAAMAADVQSLLGGNTIKRRRYTFNRPGAVGELYTLRPAPVLIMEGIFLLHYPALRNLADLSLYLECEADMRLARRQQRDPAERGTPESQLLYQWENHVLPAHDQFVAPAQIHADIILQGNTGADMGEFLLQKLIADRLG